MLGIKIHLSIYSQRILSVGKAAALCCVFSLSDLQAQYLPVSQSFETACIFNPAFTGSETQGRISTHNRLQWPELGTSLRSLSVCADLPLEIIHGGLGINFLQQNEGEWFRRSRTDLVYCWDFQATHELSFNLAIRFSWLSNRWNASGALLPGMIDPGTLQTLPSNESLSGDRRGSADLGAGMLAAWKNIYLGTSVHHLSRPFLVPGEALSGRMPLAWNAHAGVNLSTQRRLISQEKLSLSPNLIVINNGYSTSVSLGSYFIFRPLYAGIWGRINTGFRQNSLVALAGFTLGSVRLALSYDLDLLSSPESPRSGAYELSASLKFDPPAKRKRIKAIKCPKI